jgi:hypothetical protein
MAAFIRSNRLGPRGSGAGAGTSSRKTACGGEARATSLRGNGRAFAGFSLTKGCARRSDLGKMTTVLPSAGAGAAWEAAAGACAGAGEAGAATRVSATLIMFTGRQGRAPRPSGSGGR